MEQEEGWVGEEVVTTHSRNACVTYVTAPNNQNRKKGKLNRGRG